MKSAALYGHQSDGQPVQSAIGESGLHMDEKPMMVFGSDAWPEQHRSNLQQAVKSAAAASPFVTSFFDRLFEAGVPVVKMAECVERAKAVDPVIEAEFDKCASIEKSAFDFGGMMGKAKGAWDGLNPGVRGGLMGAGAGALGGLAYSALQPKDNRNSRGNALMGGLLGAGVGAAGGLAYPLLAGMGGQEQQQPQDNSQFQEPYRPQPEMQMPSTEDQLMQALMASQEQGQGQQLTPDSPFYTPQPPMGNTVPNRGAEELAFRGGMNPQLF